MIQAQSLGTGTRFGLEILQQRGRGVKTKNQRKIKDEFLFGEVKEESWQCWEVFLHPPILNRVNDNNYSNKRNSWGVIIL